jgi:hypothetical protein
MDASIGIHSCVHYNKPSFVKTKPERIIPMIQSTVYVCLGIEEQDKGKLLPSHTSLGCYPIIYISDVCDVLCATCASDDTFEDDIVAADIYYEGESIRCEGCDKTIESAYGEEGL